MSERLPGAERAALLVLSIAETDATTYRGQLYNTAGLGGVEKADYWVAFLRCTGDYVKIPGQATPRRWPTEARAHRGAELEIDRLILDRVLPDAPEPTRCSHCSMGDNRCNAELWAEQRKCCPDCEHVPTQPPGGRQKPRHKKNGGKRGH